MTKASWLWPLIIGFVLGAGVFAAGYYAHGSEQRDNQRRYYDDKGRSTGTSSVDSEGTTTFYDARGRVVGRESRQRR